jgi:hypothetical protein
MLSLSLAVWNFYFPKLFAPFLAWANAMATPLKEKKEKIPPNPIPKKKKPDPHYCTLYLSLAACKFYS